MFVWIAETNLVNFLQQVLSFCKSRIDTYAELVKDQATRMLILLSSSDESNIGVKVINTDYRLLEVVGELLCSNEQSMPVRVNCFWVLANFCGDQEHVLRHFIIQRTSFLNFLNTLQNNPIEEISELVPWLVFNIYSNGMDDVLYKDEVVSQTYNLSNIHHCLANYFHKVGWCCN